MSSPPRSTTSPPPLAPKRRGRPPKAKPQKETHTSDRDESPLRPPTNYDAAKRLVEKVNELEARLKKIADDTDSTQNVWEVIGELERDAIVYVCENCENYNLCGFGEDTTCGTCEAVFCKSCRIVHCEICKIKNTFQ